MSKCYMSHLLTHIVRLARISIPVFQMRKTNSRKVSTFTGIQNFQIKKRFCIVFFYFVFCFLVLQNYYSSVYS